MPQLLVATYRFTSPSQIARVGASLAAIMLAALVMFGCTSLPGDPDPVAGADDRGGGTPPPQPAPSASTAMLRVTADAGCAGRTSIEVTIDGSFTGVIQPGESVERTVSLGAHTVSARSREGVAWAPATVTVAANGYVFRLTCSSPAFTPRLLQPWGTWSTQASNGGLPLLQICVRDNQCEDGDILRVSVNGAVVMQRELLNEPQCGNFRFNQGSNVISIYAVNGTGYKGRCDFSDENTGEISVGNLRSTGTVVSTVQQTYAVRGGAGTESSIVVQLVR